VRYATLDRSPFSGALRWPQLADCNENHFPFVQGIKPMMAAIHFRAGAENAAS
jgi:hypothetical protein